MKAKRGTLTLLVLALFACGKGPEQTGQGQRYVRLPKDVLVNDKDTARWFNPDHKQDDTYAFGYMSTSVLNALPPSLGRAVTVLDERYEHLSFNAKTLEFSGEDELDWNLRFEGYHNYDQLTTELERLADTYPTLAQLTSAGKSHEGRELWLMKISDQVTEDEAEPKLLYIANMHGDEVVGRELMVYLIRKLLSEYQSNQQIKKLVDHAQIYIMPSMNPDGFEASHRENANGVDLNRNFPDFVDDPENSEDGREPETQHVMELHRKHHFVLALNFHGGSLCVNLPWDTKKNDLISDRFSDDALIASLGHEYAETNGAMANSGEFDRGVTYGYEWYRITGGMQDFANAYAESTHATVELSVDKFPSANRLNTYWQQNEKALVQFLQRGTEGLNINVTDADGQTLQSVDVRVNSAARRTMHFKDGVINRPTTAGVQKVWVKAPGYEERSLDIVARAFDDTRLNIQLQKQNSL